MLKGKISCWEHRYEVRGRDNSTVMSLRLSSPLYKSLNYLGSEDDNCDDYQLTERSCNIGLSSVTVETMQLVGDNGKAKKAPINELFFCKLGALISYAKTHCYSRYSDTYSDLVSADGEFDISPLVRYKVPYPHNSEFQGVFAEVSMYYGCIQSLKIDCNGFEIDLHEDPSYMEVLPAIKNGQKKGFKYSESLLGFVAEDNIPEFVSTTGMYTTIEEVIAAHPEKNLDWLNDADYKIVTDETLDSICEYIKGHDGYVYYDTETTGLNINFKSRIGQADQCVGIILSVKYGESFFFPMQMKNIENLCGGDHFYFMEHYIREILESKKIVAHNMTFDWKVGYIYNINCNIVMDTMAIIKLTIGAERDNYPMGLKDNAKLLLGRDSLELSDFIVDNSWGETDIKFWDLPANLVRLYACADTDNTQGIMEWALRNDIIAKYNASKVLEIEIAFSFAVAYQEFYGHLVDINNLAEVRKQVGAEQEKYMKLMVDIVGHEFNPNSSPQLIKIMYGELGIPEQISRKTGRPTTDKETLKKLAEITDLEDNIKYPFCSYLKSYREAEGVRKIVDKFPELMTNDGYLFSAVMQYGTTTGRVSINNPNYQSYNDPVKKNVIPRPGFYMFDTDYSSVEYRVLGNMVGNKKIMENFKDPDFDYHAYQAAHMYGVPYSAVTKKLRKAAKGINFGLPYGMGDESLGVRVFGEASEENTRKAAGLRSAYFKGQEDIRDWFEHHRSKGVQMGFTETYFGRRRYYHRDKFSDNAIRRQAGNHVIQGCIYGDTLIHDRVAGTIKIKELAGYKAEVWNGTDWTNGDVLYSGRKRKCIVKFRGGYEMICSPQHKFLVRSHRGTDRFVECKDLIPLYDGDRVRKNAHRVVVCQDFVQSDFIYSSNRVYDSQTANANNVYLDDIGDSYTQGVVLGRLSSDGTVNAERGYIAQIVAEHELDVYDYLVTAMEPLNCTDHINDLRENRNEAIARVCVYSKSLAQEIDSLDIRHTIDPSIWADTEMLRGFLRGLFDGDGGVSGKTITFVQGTQENFEPFMKEIQKALLFFGIRSRYRYYEGDRHVIQIKTTDNDRFMEVIGFINENKNIAASQLECVEDEHIFGRCLMVESVEVTDELIDMYDVCNTDCGYYVADGVVTHNTAADIYKTAVGRMFKRICREGLLGKVLFPGFIHDELLVEVSEDINPTQWLKLAREEFEVKITNEDGTPWSPLYMGCGFGTSWYEAKSVELPIKLQWELVEKYGEQGYPDWDGNGRHFCDKIPDILRDFEVRDIRNQLLDADSQGKEIKPTLNNQVFAMCEEDSKILPDATAKYLVDRDIESVLDEADYLGYLDKNYHIQSVPRDDAGNFVISFSPAKETQSAIDQYCLYHSTDRSKIDIHDIEEVSASEAKSGDAESFIGFDDDEDLDDATKKLMAIDKRVMNFGMYADPHEKVLYLKNLGMGAHMTVIRGRCTEVDDGTGYSLRFRVDMPDGTSQYLQTTKPLYIPYKEINFIQGVYIDYFKKAGQHG